MHGLNINRADKRVPCGRRSALNLADSLALVKTYWTGQNLQIIQESRTVANNKKIPTRQEKFMRDFCNFLQAPVHDMFVLELCNSHRLCLDCKDVFIAVASLSGEKMEYWRIWTFAPEETQLPNFPAEIRLIPLSKQKFTCFVALCWWYMMFKGQRSRRLR